MAALDASIQVNHSRNSSLVDVASILTDLHRQPDLAEKALREYLASPAKTDDAPSFKVHLQLGDILKKRGDTAGAQHEYLLLSSWPRTLLQRAKQRRVSEGRGYDGLHAYGWSFPGRMTLLRCLLITAACATLGSTPAIGQISFTTAIDLALKNSPKVQAAQAEVDKAYAVLSETRDVYIPTLNVGSGLGYTYGFPFGAPSLFNITIQSLLFDQSQRNYVRPHAKVWRRRTII